uniref:NADH:quinone oxidoreductase/Mrp antiporter transmembrane domain-containing protein n=1 Tax=Brassica oleracea TaxID=3712 RepID=A0A3P6HCG2_BRAOL|nr:unnamed protein product [Brassica oleracea]
MLFLPHRGNKVNKWYTICICILELLLTTYAFCYNFKLDDPLIQLSEDYKWINLFDFYWRLGIDGLSIGTILLTGFITTLATLAAFPVTRDSRLFYFLMLAMYSGQIGSFSSRIFYFFFHHVGIRINSRLSPFYPCGVERNVCIQLQNLFYTLQEVLFFIINRSFRYKFIWFERTNIKFRTIRESSLSGHTRNTLLYWISYCFCRQITDYTFTYLVLPDTHGEAHYSTCMLLAGILLKMGAYGLVRINMELLPHAHSMFSPWLMLVGTIQIIYAASTSPGQRNLKKRIAYSSVSHMGFIIIGIGSITDPGLNGAILQIISHGFIGAALFFWQELVMIESGLFILMKWVEWLSPFQRYLQCSLSYRWLPLHYRA